MFQCLGKGLLSLVSPCLMGQSFHYSIITSTQNRSVNSQNTLFSLTDSIALSEGYNKLYKAVIVWFSPVYANPRPLYPSPSIFISCSLSLAPCLWHIMISVISLLSLVAVYPLLLNYAQFVPNAINTSCIITCL